MARIISGTQNVLANATVQQIVALQNQRFNPSTENQSFAIFAAESAAGLELTISAGAEIHGENVEPAIRAAVSTRDDLIVNGVLLANSRLVVAVRNTTAGALDLFFRIVLDPL